MHFQGFLGLKMSEKLCLQWNDFKENATSVYCGEANVYQESLDYFLAIAEELQLKGLMGKTYNDGVEGNQTPKSRKSPVYKNELKILKSSLSLPKRKIMTKCQSLTMTQVLQQSHSQVTFLEICKSLTTKQTQ